jgi:hypothetical protein
MVLFRRKIKVFKGIGEMAQVGEEKPASISKKRIYYLLTILSLAGFILVGGAAYWTQNIS